MRVKFKETRVTKEAKSQTFNAGEVYDLPEPSARHWLNRGVAEEVADIPAPVKAAPAPKIQSPIKEV